MKLLSVIAVCLQFSATVWGATSINATNHFAYAANLGWLECRGDVTNGAVIGPSVCSGFVYSGNVGWINLGNGAPVNATNYLNNSALDFGVNLNSTGSLTGFAWGANIGWLTFTNRDAAGNSFEGPRVDLATGRMSGYIWSANCGWISLSNAQAYVQTALNPGTGPGLVVNSTNALIAIGGTGGPFNPSSQAYVLSNASISSLSWTSSPSAPWLTASPVSGTLAPASVVTVTVSINANASALPGGLYSEGISFVNSSTGAGNTSRQVNLTVYTGLNVSGFGLDAVGPVGGPFNPVGTDYLLGNLGTSPMNWEASNDTNWMTLSSVSGTLPGHASTTVNVAINSTANALPAGEYSGVVYFTNSTDGVGSQFRFVSLTVTNSLTPLISAQPSHYTVSPGATVSFNVSASGEGPLSYQWRRGASDVPGATLNTLALSNVSFLHSGHYAAVVSNLSGSVTSSFGTLALLTLDSVNNPRLKLTAATGDRYRVDFVDRLATNTWNLLGFVTLTNNPNSITDSNTPSTARFYRAVYSP